MTNNSNVDFWEEDRPHEECGVFGVFAPGRDVARLSFFALYALQHRGQEAAGIVVGDGQRTHSHKGMGLVSQVFNEANLSPLKAIWQSVIRAIRLRVGSISVMCSRI